MPEVKVEKPAVLDILDTRAPALSSTNDIPVVETKPDATNKGEPPAAPAAEDAASKTTSESATEHTDESTGEPAEAKKPPRGVQKRLDELARREAEANARAKAAEENLRLALEAQRIQPEKEEPAKPQAEDAPKRPVRADFSDPDAYDAAMLEYVELHARHTADQAVKAARADDEKRRQDEAAANAQKTMREAHAARIEKAKAKYADFSEVAESPDVSISMPMAHAILTHEQGADLQYYLGKNRAEAERIASYTVPMFHEGKVIQAPDAARQLLELGILAAQLRMQAATPETPAAAPAKPITKAPAPIKPQAPGTTETAKPIEEMTMEEYAEFRKPKLAAERRPGARRNS